MSTDDIALSAWFNSKWFKGTARAFAIVAGFTLPVLGGAIGWQLSRMDAFETGLARVLTTQDERADVADRREEANQAFRREVRADIDKIDGKIDDVASDVDVIKGSLQVLLQQAQTRPTALPLGQP